MAAMTLELMIVHFAHSVIAELDESLAGHEQHHQPQHHAAEAAHIGSYIDRLAETFQGRIDDHEGVDGLH
jgi:hypothetical protein